MLVPVESLGADMSHQCGGVVLIVPVAAIIVPVSLAGAYINTYIPALSYRDRHYCCTSIMLRGRREFPCILPRGHIPPPASPFQAAWCNSCSVNHYYGGP